VSFTVVPMFQMTPPYPPWLPRLLPATLGISLGAAASVALALHQTWPWILAIALAVLSAIGFALVTLRLQHRRRKARTDATHAFFRGAMIALIAAGTCWLASIPSPDLAAEPWLATCIGILCLVGVFVSAISGMLYKIVPFVGWLKLSYGGSSPTPRLNIHSFISRRAMTSQMRLHFLAIVLLLGCTVVPALVRPAGFAFAVSCGWLGTNLLGALRCYMKLKGQSRADAATHGS